MILEIKNVNDGRFISFLIMQLQKYIYNIIDVKKTQKLELYINNIEEYKSPYRKYISCKDVLLAASRNLIYRKHRGGYFIQLNDNIYYPGTNIKLSSLCKLIEYGTVHIDGMHYFRKAYLYVIDNLDFLYKQYEGR